MKMLLLSTALLAAPASACEVALMLAVDVSGSIDGDEYRIQMDGLAEALREKVIAEALILSEAEIALMQWTGTGRQSVVISWTTITSEEDILIFAQQVQDQERIWRDFSTAIGEAMELAHGYFAAVDQCERLVMDISGDGISNEGRLPSDVWPALTEAGITVNALAIENTGFPLTPWFEENVIHGPGAFVVTANGFEDYPPQIVRKLYRELTQAVSDLDTGLPESPKDAAAQ